MSTIKSFEQAHGESTCQKRVTVVELYDAAGNLLARESNRCAPSGGTCHRLGVMQGKENYDVNSHCNWTHAEINALNALPKGAVPKTAMLWGHSFYCDACEWALRAAGVETFGVITHTHPDLFLK
jgi:deoxycytidylate deaminase